VVDATLDPHVGHDLEVVASLLDADIVGTDRALAARQVAGCQACASLHRDLLVLANATRELQIPARTLDFRLTAADAIRLREPAAADGRLTDDMLDTSAHATHDTMLVASLADHSLAVPERDLAEALVATCGLCAALHLDLVALADATRAMPTPPRPRDYTLSAADAARLRPGGWRRWIAALGTSRDMFSRPLAVGLTTLGLAGLLVATVPSVLQGQGATSLSAVGRDVGAASDAQGRVTEVAPEVGAGGAAPGAAAVPSGGAAPGAAAVPSGAAPLPDNALTPSLAPVGSSAPQTGGQAILGSAAPGQGDTAGSSSKGAPAASDPAFDAGTPTVERTVDRDPIGISPMILVSGALLLAGLGLFLLRRTARRFIA